MSNIEAGLPALGGHKRSRISKRKVAIIILIGVLLIATLVTYFGIVFINALKGIGSGKGAVLPPPMLNVSLKEQDLLTFNSVSQYMPYVLIGYHSKNVTNIVANASLFKYPPPESIYIVNVTNECFYCGNPEEIDSALFSKLMAYNVIQSPSNVTFIEPSQLLQVPDDSLIIVLNGLLPNTFLQNVSGTNLTILDYLLIRHTSILYVGQQFNNVLLPDSVVIPAPQIPGYLVTAQYSGNTLDKNTGFYFNKTQFAFPYPNGTIYAGYLTYENIYNGSIAVFPNTPNSWPSANDTGSDVAKAVQEMFWLPKYAYGARTIHPPNPSNYSGSFGVVMNATPLPFSPDFANIANRNAYIRVALKYNGTSQSGMTIDSYQYIFANPQFYYNGTLGITGAMVTNETVPLTFSLVTHSNVPINVQPHLSIYNMNLTQVYSTPLSFIHNVSNNFTFLLPYERISLQPGEGYIIKLHSFYGTEYAGAFFNISPIVLTLLTANVTSDRFYFAVTSNKQRVNNLPYEISLNNNYTQKGIIKNGTIFFSVPSGTPRIIGNLNFTINVSGGTFYYHTSYSPLPFAINNQYIELVVVVVLMILIIEFVRAPNRDEFYIDVPNLPEEKKTEIKIKATDVVNVFDTLNNSYHWKFMPLSRAEVRSAITAYVRHDNMPVSLTYSNVERILDQLVAKKYLTSSDNLYAPSGWLTTSKHDMNYLATFKKLRIYLVTHGYLFTDLDMSDNADIVATVHSERKYLIIYSKTSKFQKVPVFSGSKTYLVFINQYAMDDFRNALYNSGSQDSEELKMYITADYVRLVDADNLENTLN